MISAKHDHVSIAIVSMLLTFNSRRCCLNTAASMAVDSVLYLTVLRETLGLGSGLAN